jgi:hypothetical protein
MADEKKPKGNSNIITSERIILLLVGLALLGALITASMNFIDYLGYGTFNSFSGAIVDYFFSHVWPTWKVVAACVSVLAIVGTINNVWQLRAINIEEEKIYNPSPLKATHHEEEVRPPQHDKWQKVLKYAHSSNSSDWRFAIIEADVMLEEVLRTRGYVGETIGEMLKSIDKSTLLTIDSAWEAHKVRNTIAHAGSDFQLSERETTRIIAHFEQVFKELKAI